MERSTEEVIKASLTRAIPSNTWETLVRANGKKNGKAKEILEEEVCSCLLQILSQTPQPIPPTLLSYFKQSLNQIGNQGEARLVRLEYLALKTILRNPPLSVTSLDEIFALLLEASLRSLNLSVYIYKNPEDVLAGILFSAMTIINSDISRKIPTPTLLWVERFLSSPEINNISSIDSTSLISASEAVNTAREFLLSPLASTDPFLNRLLSLLPIMQSKTQESLKLDNVYPIGSFESEVVSVQPDIQFLVNDLIHRRSSSSGISNSSNSATRIAALLLTRIKDAETTPSNSITNAFLEIMLTFTDLSNRSDLNLFQRLYDTILILRLPEIFRILFDKSGFESFNLPNGLQGCLESAITKLKSKINTETSGSSDLSERGVTQIENILTHYYRQGLISKEFALTLWTKQEEFGQIEDVASISLEEENLANTLRELLNPRGNIRATVDALIQAIENYSQSFNLSALAFTCNNLLEGSSEYLEIIFLFEEPRMILAPLTQFLDTIDSAGESFGEEHAAEKYGTIAQFLLIIISRFDLHQDISYHLGTSGGFVSHWISSLSAVYPLSSMDEESSTAVNNWIRDLFGEGISDELMQSTDPRVLLRVAPTICKQSLAACQAGVIDIETLREGLSYLLHDILSFTLPGVLLWLISEIGRTITSPAQSTMNDILQLFIFSELLPSTVLELISTELEQLASKLSILSTPPMEISKINDLVIPFCETTHDLLPQTTWLQQLAEDITNTIDPILFISPTPSPPNLSISLHYSLAQFSPSTVLSTILKTLINLTRTLPDIFDINEWSRNNRIRKCGRSLIGVKTERNWNLLDCGVREYIETYCDKLRLSAGNKRERVEGIEKVRIEMMLKIWLDSFNQAFEGEKLNNVEGSNTVVNLIEDLSDKVKKMKGIVIAEDGVQTGLDLFLTNFLNGLESIEGKVM